MYHAVCYRKYWGIFVLVLVDMNNVQIYKNCRAAPNLTWQWYNNTFHLQKETKHTLFYIENIYYSKINHKCNY